MWEMLVAGNGGTIQHACSLTEAVSAALIWGAEITHKLSTLLTAFLYHRMRHGKAEPAVGKRGVRHKTFDRVMLSHCHQLL